MPLGKTLKALRQKQSMNQKALSALSGVSQATISRIETGRVQQLRSAALKNLADALGVSVDFLMGDSEVFAQIPGPGAQPPSTIPGVREDRFRQIADMLDAFVVHEQGRILYVNQTFAEALGYRKEELLGKNGVELITAPQSRNTVQRMISSVSTDPYEVLFVRKDGSVVPVELLGRNLTETIRLAVMHDVTVRRCHQAVTRVQRAGLEAESLEDLERVTRIMADELEDMGLPFEGAGVTIIDQPRDRMLVFVAHPESRGYRTFRQVFALRHGMETYSALRGLVSNWRRRKTWEREPDEEYDKLMQDSSMGSGYRPRVLLDVPHLLGTLGMGLPAARGVRVENAAQILALLEPTISCVAKRLLAADTLGEQLRALQRQPTGQGAG